MRLLRTLRVLAMTQRDLRGNTPCGRGRNTAHENAILREYSASETPFALADLSGYAAPTRPTAEG